MAMRISIGILVTATVLFLLGALGVLGTWALGTATVAGLIGGVGAVTVMEGRDFTHSSGRAPHHLSVAGLATGDDTQLTA